MQKSNMPEASFDPAEDMEPSGKNGDRSHGSHGAGADFQDDSPEDEHIQKGMSARGVMRGLSLVTGLALAGLALYAQFSSETRVTPTSDLAQMPQSSKPTLSVIDELRNEALLAAPASAAQTPDPITDAPSPEPISHEPLDEGPSKEDMAISSPMTVGISLRGRNSAEGEMQGGYAGMHPALAGLRPPAEDQITGILNNLQRDLAANMRGQGEGTEAAQLQNALTIAQKDSATRFMESAGARQIEPPMKLQPQRAAASLYEGTIVRAVLTRGINTDTPGIFTARVTQDLYDSVTMRTLLVPRGSELTCMYQSGLDVGQSLVMAACHRLRLPNGKSFNMAGTAAGDMSGNNGLPADINNHYWKIFSSAAIMGAASLLMPERDRNITSASTAAGAQTGGSILGMAFNRAIEQTLNRNMRIGPTGTVEIGTPFTLTLARDVELEPYGGRR